MSLASAHRKTSCQMENHMWSNLFFKQETIPYLRHWNAGRRWSQCRVEATDRRGLREQVHLTNFFCYRRDRRRLPGSQPGGTSIKTLSYFSGSASPDRSSSVSVIWPPSIELTRELVDISCRWWRCTFLLTPTASPSPRLPDGLTCQDFPSCFPSLYRQM